MTEQDSERSRLVPGTVVFNKAGQEGTFKGYSEREGKQYGEFQFGDILTLLPTDIISSRIALSPPLSPDKKLTLSERVLKILDNPETYFMPYFENMSEEQRQELKVLIEEARKMKAVFRGDSRHPTIPDRDHPNIYKPPFLDGFKIDEHIIGNAVHTTTNIDIAIEYPDEVYEEKFLYIIRPDTLLKTLKSFRSGKRKNEIIYTEICSGSIPPSDIYAAIGHIEGRMTEIYMNPNFKNDITT
jgi:hypothetical protein